MTDRTSTVPSAKLTSVDTTSGAARPARRPPLAALWLTSLAVVLVAGACSSSASDRSGEADATAVGQARRGRDVVLDAADDACRDGLDELCGALSDGEVTLEEYRAGVTRTLACINDAGYSVTEPYLNPVDGLMFLYEVRYGTQDPQEVGDALGRCSGRYEAAFQTTYGATHPARMAPELLDATIACLTDAGHHVNGDEHNAPDLVATLGESRRHAVTACVEQEHERLYPDRSLTYTS